MPFRSTDILAPFFKQKSPNDFCLKKKSPNDLGEILAKQKLVGRLFGPFCGDWAIFSQNIWSP
jgi:hypothetical protein